MLLDSKQLRLAPAFRNVTFYNSGLARSENRTQCRLPSSLGYRTVSDTIDNNVNY